MIGSTPLPECCMPLRPSAARFRLAFNGLEALIEQRYGIPVRIRDVPDPFTGDLDGAEIHVDYDVDGEEALFIVAHLFGHTVQWAQGESLRRLGEQEPDPQISSARLAELHQYELDAARYSLALFHEAGLHDFDQWVSDYFRCDWAYLENFYRTGERGQFRRFWRDGTETITPLPIPPFRPEAWRNRFGGTVV